MQNLHQFHEFSEIHFICCYVIADKHTYFRFQRGRERAREDRTSRFQYGQPNLAKAVVRGQVPFFADFSSPDNIMICSCYEVSNIGL